MITRTVNISDRDLFYDSCDCIGSFLKGSCASDLLFFDIETTGLSPKEACIYLIGCMYESADGPVLTQLFSEDPSEEKDILSAFCDIAQTHCTPVHYNGSTFDIPFLNARAAVWGITLPSFAMQLDIYRELKPVKNLLGLKSLRMKAVEKYLGIDREDMYDGGELIELYIKYISLKKLEKLRTGAPSENNGVTGETGVSRADGAAGETGVTRADGASGTGRSSGRSRIVPSFSDYSGLRLIGREDSLELLKILLLHNYEDVENMIHVAQILRLPAFIKGAYTVDPVSLDPVSDIYIPGVSGVYGVSRVSAIPETSGVSEVSYVPGTSGVSGISHTPGSSDVAGIFHASVGNKPTNLRVSIILRPDHPQVIGLLRSCKKHFTVPAAGPEHVDVDLTIIENEAAVCLETEVTDTELKLFFADYRNYYYLINEDYAIHKSVGQFVDKERCVKCTAANCYTRKQGMFVPVFEKKGGALADKVHLYRKSAPDRSFYILADDLAADPEIAEIYAGQILSVLNASS